MAEVYRQSWALTTAREVTTYLATLTATVHACSGLEVDLQLRTADELRSISPAPSFGVSIVPMPREAG